MNIVPYSDEIDQYLRMDDAAAPILIYHGLNGVYIQEYDKRTELGEADNFVVYPKPDVKVLSKLRENRTRTELQDNLPTELGYYAE